ncbi:hypothetical protein MHH52_23940 [Paenibacillus sp. FSL K6-0276]|uniref:hypothetical protein n=1 Tax=Paenibacillus sp. FSL K6-0276 TaxID=2921450 RepID=UPI0030EE04AC
MEYTFIIPSIASTRLIRRCSVLLALLPLRRSDLSESKYLRVLDELKEKSVSA